jgi:hypothetical protein
MNPVIVDSTLCHLWTDVLHMRQLARDCTNRWDRGTYVRFCTIAAWTALEVACQDALDCPEIGHRFKENVDTAILNKGLLSLDWSTGIWQEVRLLQERRKSYIHKFAKLSDMFPESDDADEAVHIVRSAISAVFAHTGAEAPAWLGFDHAYGWAASSGLSDTCNATLITGGTTLDDPTAIRIKIVTNGEELTSSIHPAGTDYQNEVDHLIRNVRVPINAVRIYEGDILVSEKLIQIRGNV